ncbi:DUF4350 domain-containing protein [Gleimia hominis]|uniref:DUF4350 domain-containing protein n=1 Tax=Gleimia hominis TaxID=595468 RepID=UPI000C7FFF0E|nr:DUF4350 domain-containing protein [Gleimia hominis]WIK64334.1 DUF4350 domain-containing protein [Gleimia hominis]
MSESKPLTRNTRAIVMWVVIAVVAVVLLAWFGPSSKEQVPLDAKSPGPMGTKAVVQVLKQHGVKTQSIHWANQLEAVQGKTVVITDVDAIEEKDVAKVRNALKKARRTVILGGSEQRLHDLGINVRAGQAQTIAKTTYLNVHCTAGVFGNAKMVDGLAMRFTAASTEDAPENCVGEPALTLPANERHPQTVLLGDPTIYTNVSIRYYDNAAAALASLSASEDLIWYLPVLDPKTEVDPTATGFLLLMPPWFYSAAVLAGLAVLALMLWRGRRFGRLATEPLPVVVRATETTEALGRLYEQSADPGVPLEAIRVGARHQLARAFGLGTHFHPAVLVRRVAARTEREENQVRDALYGKQIVYKTELIHYSRLITQILQEVTHD